MRFLFSTYQTEPDRHTDEYVPQIRPTSAEEQTHGWKIHPGCKESDHDEGRQRRVDASRQGLADTGVDDRLSGLFIAQKLHILTDTVEDNDRRVD